jgi:hypothetical protein
MATNAKKQPSTWLGLQKQSKEEIDLEALELDNEKALNRTNNDIHNAKTVVSEKKKALSNAKRATSFSAVSVLNAERELALATKDVEDLTRIKNEMFEA